MNLFEPIVDKSLFHPNFSRIIDQKRVSEQAEFQRWAEGFPDRDGKFVKEFQTTFNSSFWEVYLYAVFRDYGFGFDWSANSPDFHLTGNGKSFIVEATTANAAQGKPKEWEKNQFLDGLNEQAAKISLNELNRESIVRLSNAFYAKSKYYTEKYINLQHVKGKPFVIAIAPFEQPNFNLQYNRPIVTLLYDYYVDEEAFLKNPELYPDGPPGRQLHYVKKDNGADLQLGLFCDDRAANVSAVIFSCTATWGKVDAMTRNKDIKRLFMTVWGTEPNGRPEKRVHKSEDYHELISDGLQVYHNPYALRPLPAETFRRPGVVQWFAKPKTKELLVEEESSCLMYRMVQTFSPDL